jgi:Cu+-exporting ATPase
VPNPSAQDFVNLAGTGVEASVGGRRVFVGRTGSLGRVGAALPPHLEAEAVRLESAGSTVVAVAAEGSVLGLLALSDRVKATSRAAVAQLRALGLTPVMLTGDNERSARAVAQEVGIERVVAGVLPEAKAAEVRRLQQAGETVAMVGDGINDAPALAQADVGIAVGTGTDIAIEASDITVSSADLRAVGVAIDLSRRAFSTIKANLFWAFAYNLVAVPLAVAGVVSPAVAAAAMAASSVLVVSNSLRLLRFQPREVRP